MALAMQFRDFEVRQFMDTSRRMVILECAESSVVIALQNTTFEEPCDDRSLKRTFSTSTLCTALPPSAPVQSQSLGSCTPRICSVRFASERLPASSESVGNAGSIPRRAKVP